ncbi:MAG: ABC transporter substrate-binding protein [Lachnospiraceae bacterium]
MKRFTRLLAGVLAGCVLTGLVGCGAGSAEQTAGETEETQVVLAPAETNDETSDAEETAERIVIEYWHKNSETAGGPTIEEYAEIFNASQDKYEVKPVFMTEDYKGIMQQLQAEAAAGNAPAVIQVGYYWLNYFTENHQYVDIKELDESYLDNYLPNIIELCTTQDGKVAGVPYSLSTPVMYYNVDLLKEAGLDTDNLPQTIDELYDWARTVKENTGEYGLAIAAASDFWIEQFEIESNGGRMVNYNDDGTMTATFASEEGCEALQKMSDLINEDRAATYVLGEPIKEAFSSGKVAMISATIGWSTGIIDASDFEMVTGPMPSYGANERRIPVGGNFLAITALDEEEQQGAWEWIQFITTAEAHVDWTKATGYVPPRKDVNELEEFQEYLKEAPQLNACLDQMEYLVPFVSFPGDAGLEIEQGLLDTRDVIMNGEKTATEALGEMQEKANELMAQ